jgi:acetyl esterase/lipase
MKKLLWGAIYVLVFIVSFVGAIAATIMAPHSFTGIDAVEWRDSMGTIETDIPYAEGELNKFDLYLPADRARATKLVVYIHAGGFTGGDKADDEGIAKFFASLGYVAATINYSLRTEANTANISDMSREIQQGVAAIVAASSERGYALDGMVIAGGSAGGTLALIYAYRDGANAPIPVEAVINMVGPASFEPASWFGVNDGYASTESAQAGAGFVSLLTGDEVSAEMMRSGAYRDSLAPITPTSLVTPEAPPTLLAYGALDKVAPFAASVELLEALQRNGVPHDALVFPNSGHALNRDPEMSTQLGEKIREYLSRYAPLG